MPQWIEYHTSSIDHLQRAEGMLRANIDRVGELNPAFLYYASLELRIAIERVVWELMALSKQSAGKLDDLSKKEIKLYRPSEIWRTINTIDPLLEKRMLFLRILSQIDPSIVELTKTAISDPVFEIPDIDSLDQIYGKLGSYLHAIEKRKATVNNPEYWETFLDLIQEASKLVYRTARSRIVFTPTGRAAEAFQMFADGSTKEQIIAFMNAQSSAQ